MNILKRIENQDKRLKKCLIFAGIIFALMFFFGDLKPALAIVVADGDQAGALSSPVGDNIEAGARSKLLLHQIKITSDEGGGSGCTIEAITLTETGSADGLNDFDRVHLIIDANNNGIKDATENPLSASSPFSFALDDGSLTINLNSIAGGQFGIADGASIQLFIAVDTNASFSATTADILHITVDQVQASQWSTGTARNWAGPSLDSRDIRAIGKVTYAQGPGMPAAANVSSETNLTNYPVFQFDLSATLENITVNTITVKQIGTIDETTGITNVSLVQDINQNGTYEAGTETLIDSGGSFLAGICSLNPNRVIAAGVTETYLVLISTVNGNFIAGETIQLQIDTPATSFSILGESSGQSILPATSTSQSGNIMTGVGSYTATIGASTPADSNVNGGVQTGIPVMQLTLTASGEENMNVSEITLTESGTVIGNTGITRVWCAVDIDGNGVLNGAEAEQSTSTAGNAVFATDNGTATLKFNSSILITNAVNLLFFYDTTATFKGGQTLLASLNNPSVDIISTGVTSGKTVACSTSIAVNSNTLTGIGTFSMSLGGVSPTGGVDTGANNNLPVMQVTITAGTAEDVKVTQMILEETDNTNPDQDITLVSIADDSDSNGLYSTGDTIFGTGTISAAGVSTINLTINDLIVAAGTSRDILVLVNTDGTNFQFDDKLHFRIVTPSNDVAAQGVDSLQTIQALVPTITGNVLSAAGGIGLISDLGTPANGVTLEGTGTNYPVWLLEFEATDDEDVLIDSITVYESGTCDAANDISTVSLIYDANDDDILDAGEIALNNTGIGTFDGANGKITLDPTGAGADTAMTVSSGTTKSFFLVVSPSATFTGGKTIILRIPDVKQGYSARGVSSGFIVSDPSTTQLSSNQILAKGSYTTAQGDNPQGGGLDYGANTGVAFAHLKITAGGEAINISSITVTEAGSADGLTDMTNVGLVVDDGAGGGNADDGVINGSEAILAGTGVVGFNADNGTIVLTPTTPVNIAANTTKSFIVTCDTVAGIPGFDVTDTLKVIINDPETDITANGTLSNEALSDISGNTLIGSAETGVTGQGLVKMKAGPVMPPAAGISYGANSDIPVLQISIGAHGESMDIDNLKITEAGTADGVAHISALNFVIDNSGGTGNGLYDGGESYLTYTSAGHPGFGSDNGTETADFDIATPISVAAGTTVEVLVLFDTSAAFPVNVTLRPQISNLSTAYEAIGGLTAFTLHDKSTFSISGNEIRSSGMATLSIGADTPLSGGTTAGSRTDLPVAQFVLTPAGENINLTSLRISEKGTAHAVDDITGIDIVFEDFATANGIVDGTESKVTLSSGRTFLTDNGTLNLTFADKAVTTGNPLSIILLVNTDNSFLVSEGDTLIFEVSAPNSDLGIAGLTSSQIIQANPTTPVTGNIITAAGTIAAASGPAMPTAQNYVEGAHARIPVLQLRFNASMEDIDISSLMITESGTCDEENDLANIGLVLDTDHSGTVNGLEAVISGTGTATFPSGGVITLTPDVPVTVPAGGYVDLLVVCDTLVGFDGGDTIVFALNDPSTDYASQGRSSGINVSDTQTTSLASSVMTGIGTISMALGSQTPLAGGVGAGANTNVSIMQLALTAGTEDIRVSNITVMEAGSANGSADLSACGLVIDTNNNGVVDGVEDKIAGTGTASDVFASDNGRLTLTPTSAITVPANSEVNLLVVFDTTATFVIGRTLRCEITNPSVDYVCVGSASTKSIVDPSTTSIVSNSLTGAGTISASIGINSPSDTNIAAGTSTSVTGLQLAFTAGTEESIKITSITLNETGTADAANDITNVGIVVDDGAGGGISGDGIINGTEQIVLGTSAAMFNGADGQIILTPSSAISIPAGIKRNLLIVFDTTATFAAGDTIILSMSNPQTDYSSQGLTSTQTIRDTSTTTLTGPTLTGTGSLNVSAGIANPGDSVITAGAVINNQAVLQVRLDAGSIEPLTIDSIKVTEAGTVLGDTEISQVDFIVDLNNNGIKDVGENAIARSGAATFPANNGTLELVPTGSVIVPAADSVNILVVVNLISNIAAGKTVKLVITNPSQDIKVTGGSSAQTIYPATATSIQGGTLTYSGNFAMTLGAATPASKGITAGINSNVPVQQLTFTAGPGENIRITALTVTESGTAHGTTDISSVGMVVDTNSNGIIDNGETVVAGTGSQTFSSDNGTVILNPSSPIEIGANLGASILLTASTTATFSADSNPSDALNFKINNPSIDCIALGVSSNLGISDPSTVSLVSNTLTAAGGVTLTTGPANPIAGGVPYGSNTGLGVMQLRFAASAIEDVTIDSITLTESGTVIGNTEITGVGLFLDNGVGGGVASNGIQDGTEITLVNPAASLIAADNGNITLIPGTLVQVPAGQTVDLMVTVNTDASLIVNRSISFKINNPSVDYVATGVNSGSRVTDISGFNIVSNTLTTRGVMNVSLGTVPVSGAVTAGVNDNLVVAQLLIEALGEQINISGITITETGSAHGVNHIDNVGIVVDNGVGGGIASNGIIDGSEAAVAGTGIAAFSVDNSAMTLNFTTPQSMAAGSTTSFLVTFDSTADFSAGNSFSISVNTPATDIAAAGHSSAQIIPAAQSTALTGPVLTARGAASVSAGIKNPVSRGISSVNTLAGVPVLQFTIMGTGENLLLNSVTLSESGTADASAAVNLIRIYEDSDASGTVNGSETPVALTGGVIFNGANGTAQLIFSSPVVITADTSKTFLVTLDTDATQFNVTETLTASIADPLTHISVQGQGSGQAISISGGAVIGGTLTGAGEVSMTFGTNNPGASFVNDNIGARVMAQLKLSAQAEDMTLTGITVEESGSADGVTDITGVFLYEDNGAGGGIANDGIINGAEAALATTVPVTFTADNGKARLTFTAPPTIGTVTPSNFLLVFTTGVTFVGGENLRFRVGNPSVDYTVQGVASAATVTDNSKLALEGATLTAVGTIAAVAGPANPGNQNIPGGQRTDIPVMQVTFTAGSENVNIEGITFTESGSAVGNVDISGISVFADDGVGGGTANDGKINGSEAAIQLSSGNTFAADNGTVSLVFTTPVTVTANSSSNFILSVSTNATFQTVQNDDLLFSIADPSNHYIARGVSSSGLVSDTSAVAITSGTLTAIGNLQVSQGVAMPGTTNIPSGATTTNVVLAQYKLTAGGEDIIVNSVKISKLGTCQDSDITAVKLIFDNGVGGGNAANGIIDGTEAPIAGGTGVFSSGSYTFDITAAAQADRTVAINDELSFMIVADMNTGYTAGETIWTAIADPSNDINATGNVSSQPVTPLAITMIQSSIFTSAGTLAVTTGDNPPVAKNITEGINSGVVVQQFKLAVAGETVNIDSISLTETGSAIGNQDISNVYLVLDDGTGGGTADDGIYSVGETIVTATTGTTFVADNGRVSWDLSGSPISIASGGYLNILVVADTATSLTGGKTLVFSVADPSADIVGSGATSSAVIKHFSNTTAVTSSVVTSVGTLSASSGLGMPQAGAVEFGIATGVELSQIIFTPGSGENINVNSISLSESGNANGSQDLSDVYLVLDNGAGGGIAGNGKIDGTESIIAGTSGGTFAADNGTLLLTPSSPILVQANTPSYIIVAGNTSATFGVGETLKLDIINPAVDINATGVSSLQTVTVSGGAVNSNLLTAAGKISLSAGPVPALNSLVPGGVNQNVLVMSLVFSAQGENSSVYSITLAESGTVDAGADITGCGLIVDANSNNVLDANETLLAGTGTQTFSGADGTVVIAPSAPIAITAGSPVTVFAVVSTGSSFGDGSTIQVSVVDPAINYTVTGALTGLSISDSSNIAVTANQITAVVPCSSLVGEVTPNIINSDGVTVNSFTYAMSPVINATNSGVNRFEISIPTEYTSVNLVNVKKGGAYLARGVDFTDQVTSNTIRVDLGTKMTSAQTGTEVVFYFTAVSPGYAQVGEKQFAGFADDTNYPSAVLAQAGNAGPSVTSSSLTVTAGGVEYFNVTASDMTPLTGKETELIITAMDRFDKIVTFFDGNVTVTAEKASALDRLKYSGTSVTDNNNGSCSVSNTGTEWSNGVLRVKVSYDIAGEGIEFVLYEKDTGLNKSGRSKGIIWQSEQASAAVIASSTSETKIQLTNGASLIISPGSVNENINVIVKQNNTVSDRDDNNVKIPDPEDLNTNLSSVRQDAQTNGTLLSFDVTPHDTVLARPAEFKVPVPDYITPSEQEKLRLYQWDGYEWIGIGGSPVMVNAKAYIQTSIQRFGLIRLVKVSNLSISAGGKLIESISFVNNPFSPNDDGINDNLIVRLTLSKSATVTLKIYDSAGDLIHKITSGEKVSSGENSWEWRGKTKWGDSVEPGVYIMRIEVSTPSGGADENAMIGVVY